MSILPRKANGGQEDQQPETKQTLQAALSYIERGWTPTPVTSGDKIPVLKGWQETTIRKEDASHYFKDGMSVGLVLGKLSRGLVCVDLDTEEAIKLAPHFLPSTDRIDGRINKPKSHWYFECDPLPPHKSFNASGFKKPIVELLAQGQQVVAPPSVYGGGETREWAVEGDPTRISGDVLLERVTRLAVASALLSIWPSGPNTGIRHDATKHLSGGLARAGWTKEEVDHLVEILCAESGDGEVKDRLLVVESTFERFGDEEKITGWPSLTGLLGPESFAVLTRVMEWLGITDIDLDDPRPVIRLGASGLDKTTNEVWDALQSENWNVTEEGDEEQSDPFLFLNGGVPVRTEYNRSSERIVIRPLTAYHMRFHMAEKIRWMKVTAKGQVIPEHPPISIVHNVMATPNPPLPVLDRIAPAPIFGSSGELITKSGYNESAKAYVDLALGLEIPKIPERPTQAQIDAARELILDDLLADFVFVTDDDRAVAVALLLLPFGSEFIKGKTPLHLIEAPTAGTGKGLLMQVLTGVFTGASGAPTVAEAKSREEWDKTITSALVEGAAYIAVDNVNSKLEDSALVAAITSPMWTGRLLGTNQMYVAEPRCIWIATGNNVQMTEEMIRRTARIRMDTGMERPSKRGNFKHKLPTWAIENRADLIAAALTLWQAWIAADKPKGNGSKGSFEDWLEVMGGVLAVAGIPGRLDDDEALFEEKNTEGGGWYEMVDMWASRYQGTEVQASVLALLAEGIEGVESKGGVTGFGVALARQKDRIYGNYKIAFGSTTRTKTRQYKLVRLDESQPWPERQILTPLPKTENQATPPPSRSPFDRANMKRQSGD